MDQHMQNQLNRKYNCISPQTRKEALKLLVNEKMSVKEVASHLNIKLGTCYAIQKVFKKSGRQTKKVTRKKKVLLETQIKLKIQHPLSLNTSIIELKKQSQVFNELQNDNENLEVNKLQFQKDFVEITNQMMKGASQLPHLQIKNSISEFLQYCQNWMKTPSKKIQSEEGPTPTVINPASLSKIPVNFLLQHLLQTHQRLQLIQDLIRLKSQIN